MDRMSQDVSKGEEPEFADLLIEMETKRLLVVQHVSDGQMIGSTGYDPCWYVNDFGTGQAAGTVSLKEWKKDERYRHLGKLDERAWRAAIEATKAVKVVCDGGCESLSNSAGSAVRTSDMVCSCGKLYSRHPYCAQSKMSESLAGGSRPVYFLHVVCDGRHVKL